MGLLQGNEGEVGVVLVKPHLEGPGHAEGPHLRHHPHGGHGPLGGDGGNRLAGEDPQIPGQLPSQKNPRAGTAGQVVDGASADPPGQLRQMGRRLAIQLWRNGSGTRTRETKGFMFASKAGPRRFSATPSACSATSIPPSRPSEERGHCGQRALTRLTC